MEHELWAFQTKRKVKMPALIEATVYWKVHLSKRAVENSITVSSTEERCLNYTVAIRADNTNKDVP